MAVSVKVSANNKAILRCASDRTGGAVSEASRTGKEIIEIMAADSSTREKRNQVVKSSSVSINLPKYRSASVPIWCNATDQKSQCGERFGY